MSAGDVLDADADADADADPDAGAIAAAVQAVLAEPSYRDAAGRTAAASRQAGNQTAAVADLEHLLSP